MACPHCGVPNSPDARFCGHCGRSLDSDAATVAVPEQAKGADRAPSSGGWLTGSDSISHGRFEPGAILDGRYRILALLGRGGMGEVYRADDLRLGQPVALKFLPDTVATDPVRLAQFHNEVRTARQISHPNICRVHDIGEIGGQLFLSMEYVDGEDLASSLRRIGRFPEDKATDIARQLCAGLAAAHERGVLHRDLKPANIMLDGAGKVRLMDFGLAAVGKVEDIRVGTPAYMAPEQLLGREVTQRSDIFALGLVLYELFTGRRVFNAATLNDLVEQHQSGQLTPPRTIVSTIDPATERAILRCLDPDPARRPSSALAVAAALPGGDPLAAALAAGETPSPEMVAAAGEGEGLSRPVAIPLFAAVCVGIAAAYVMALRTSPLELIRPSYTSDVLAQKARDAVRQLGYVDRPHDEAYGFGWDGDLIDHMRPGVETPRHWQDVLSRRPSPLYFWYRSSQSAMIGLQFHHDLLTPGIVTRDDPAPIESGMRQLTLDHQGLLTSFEAIPPQVQQPRSTVGAIDWTPVLTLAGLDVATLQPAEPQWNWLASADTRVAWTGTWPGSGQPLRAEAAGLQGQPVAFLLTGPWTKPWREPAPPTGQDTASVLILFVLALAIIIGGTVLARKNVIEGRGDNAGARALGRTIVAGLWLLWICQVHVSISPGILGIFLLAFATTVFYGVLLWAIYLALEPFVRRHWPQTLVSWTTLLRGHVGDPIVGRDMLVGVALGVSIALLIRTASLLNLGGLDVPSTEPLLGLRSTAGVILSVALYAIRAALFFFFLLFLLRVLLGRQWAAGVVFALIFSLLNALEGDRPLVAFLIAGVYASVFAIAVLRWGLTTLAVGVLVANLLLNVPATTDLAAWYVDETALMFAIPLLLAARAFYTSLGGRVWKGAIA